MTLQETTENLRDTLSLQVGKINPTLEVTISNGCNKRCKYCFEHNQPKSRDLEEECRQLEIIERVCKEFDHSRFGRLNLSFWGGEPLMNVDWLEKIISSTINYEFVDYHMFTNGTLLENLKTLVDGLTTSQAFKCGRFRIQVSHDGSPHHELKREYGSCEVLPTLDFLAERDIPFSLKATITEDSVQLMPECWKSYEKLYDKYGRQISYCPTLDTSSELENVDLQLWVEIAKQLAKLEFKFIQKHHHPLMSWFKRDQKRICDVRNTIHMHTDGNLYVCHGAPYLDAGKRDKFVITTTKKLLESNDIQNELFRDDLIDASSRAQECLVCEATFCGMCHVGIVDPQHFKDHWIPCMVCQKKRCQIYREFGKVARALSFALSKNW